ncbi:hypothetical protein [Streptomyces goshikiensis]|uniref:hypothetical protein n=1 Tax=Streptomyces goshikiensis TaxID=1942 RepID=UPI0033DCC5AC
MDIIFEQLDEVERRRAIATYLEILGSPEAFIADLLAAASPEYLGQVAESLMAP